MDHLDTSEDVVSYQHYSLQVKMHVHDGDQIEEVY